MIEVSMSHLGKIDGKLYFIEFVKIYFTLQIGKIGYYGLRFEVFMNKINTEKRLIFNIVIFASLQFFK